MSARDNPVTLAQAVIQATLEPFRGSLDEVLILGRVIDTLALRDEAGRVIEPEAITSEYCHAQVLRWIERRREVLERERAAWAARSEAT
jgi:hypothetical protein